MTFSVRNEKAHLLWAFFLSLLAGCADDQRVEPQESAQLDQRPNIIFLLADDQRADSLSIAGHPYVQTPNLDALARQGVRYDNAFTVAPICAPSRYAFLSGQYERTSGLGFNSPYQVSEKQWQKTYPALLRDAGFYTGFVGKFGVQFYTFIGETEEKFDYWRAHDGWLPFFPKDLPDNPATEIYRDADSDITTEIMAEYIDEFLESVPRDQPFNLSVSFSSPHNSVVSTMYPEGADPDCESYACRVMGYPASGNPRLSNHAVYGDLYRDQEVVIAEDTGKDPYRFIPEGVIDHTARRQWYDYNYEPTMQPEHLVRYHQNVTGIDRVVGQVRKSLDVLGLADNTVIIYSSDHGLLNGEYGTGGKALLYDLVAKIPLIVFDPRATDAANVNTDLVLSIDVPSTILSYAGLTPPVDMQGRDLIGGQAPQVNRVNSGQAPRDAVFLESLTVAEGNPFVEAIRTREWKYVRYIEPQGCPYAEEHLDFSSSEPIFEQLFNLVADPDERHNLVNVAEHAELLAGFRSRIRDASIAMTEEGRRYKREIGVPLRPADGVYCW